PDEVIEDEIREDLIRRVLFIDPEELAVTVDNGVVTLGGEVGTKREALMIAELTRRLDGVMRVENDLTFRIDDTG
ncbi:MAG: BON domain-containing protein, partial [Acidimicrobiia bacterium]|nr:BON domain-containing protein [Acidimicrobiia bacterium]